MGQFITTHTHTQIVTKIQADFVKAQNQMRRLNFLCFDSLMFFDLLRLNMTQTFAAELKIFN